MASLWSYGPYLLYLGGHTPPDAPKLLAFLGAWLGSASPLAEDSLLQMPLPQAWPTCSPSSSRYLLGSRHGLWGAAPLLQALGNNTGILRTVKELPSGVGPGRQASLSPATRVPAGAVLRTARPGPRRRGDWRTWAWGWGWAQLAQRVPGLGLILSTT